MQKEDLYQLIEMPAAMNESTAAEFKELTVRYPWFSLAWILYLKNLKLIHSYEYETVLKNVAIRVSNRKLLHRYVNSEISIQPHKIGLGNSFSVLNDLQPETETKNDSLIDKFLASNPGIIRRKFNEENEIESESKSDFLEKSTSESDELITETLANIYFQQKNFEKALQAYQKLSLKYPEKSVYFASRIKEIEDLKNIN